MSEGVTNNKRRIDKAISDLEAVYNQLPDTQNCLHYINLPEDQGGCGAWCCRYQNPHVLYTEFLRTWRHVLKEWSADQITDLLEASLRNYLNDHVNKSCVFWNKETKLCTIHKHRPFQCFLPDTYIYTDSGPKMIKEVLPGDYVIGHNSVWHRVTATMSQIHEGAIYNVRPKGSFLDCWCTDDHLWRTIQSDGINILRSSWTEARELEYKKGKLADHYLISPMFWDDINSCGIDKIDVLDFIRGYTVNGGVKVLDLNYSDQQKLPRYIDVDEDFLFLLGIYLAAGYSSYQGGIRIGMHKNNKFRLDRIKVYLEELGIKAYYVKKDKKNQVKLAAGGSVLGRLMKTLCGELSDSKKLNQTLFKLLNSYQKKEIFKSYDIGNDLTDNHSLPLLLQMKMIMQQNYIMECLSTSLKFNPDIRQLSLNDNLRDSFALYTPLTEIKATHYEGPVFDIEVEGSHCFATTSGIAHNCMTYGIEPEEEFRPKYERLKVLYQDRPDAVIRDQCNLIETTDGSKLTKKMIDDWWKQLTEVEESIGVDKEEITDKPGGTYRTFHDHILLYLCNDEIMNKLQMLRQHGNKQECETAIKGLVEAFRKNLKTQMEGQSESSDN